MIPVVVTRKPGQAPLDRPTVEHLVGQHFLIDEQARETWADMARYQQAVVDLFLCPCIRAEGYLYKDDGVTPIAMAMYARVLDMHYGMMAQPIMIFIEPEYRGDLKVTRAVSNLVKSAVRKLGVSWYSVSKHPASNIQQSVTRRI